MGLNLAGVQLAPQTAISLLTCSLRGLPVSGNRDSHLMQNHRAGIPVTREALAGTVSTLTQVRPARALGQTVREPLGIVFTLSLVWLLFDLGRPPTPPGVPLLISAVMFTDWIIKKDKQWSRQSPLWFALLGLVAVGIFFAPNTYAVYFNTRLLGTLVLGVCLPLQALITNVQRARLWILSLVAVAFYVGAWALSHGGYGPASSNGQDENYVATLMVMGVALAYFALFAEKRFGVRLMLGAAMAVFVAAMAVADNPSRGGFVGLCAVALYCLARSPKKLAGIGILSAVALALFLVAGPSFWKEIDTTTDYQTGTGDMRLEIWKAGLRMWEANPILGVGSGNFRWVIGDYQSAEQFAKFGRSLGGSIIAHSMHVELLAELGSLGAIVVGLLVWRTWTGLGKLRVEKAKPGQPPVDPDLIRLSYYADALRACMVAVLVSGAFLSLLYYSHLWVLLAVGSALPFVHRRILARQGGVEPTRSAVAWRTASSASVSPGVEAPSSFDRRGGSWGRR
jgi:O-antigen ligase